MSPMEERWERSKRLFHEVFPLPPSERVRVLASEPEEIRREVEGLLAVTEGEAGRFDDIRFRRRDFEVRLPPNTLIGEHYRIERYLAEGGMAEVYLARDTRNDREVALKIVFASVRSRSPVEDLLLARLSHDYIATFYESGKTERGELFVAMEYVGGLHIDRYSQVKNLSLKERLELFLKVLEAVAYAHQNLVVHRDLKPANILVTDEGKPRLLDFGIAKLLPQEIADATLTHLSNRPYTLQFASPEQISGEVTSPASDIYSLGVLLCLLLTGKLPYAEEKNSNLLPAAIFAGEVGKPSEVVGNPKFISWPSTSPPSERALSQRLSGELDAIILRALRTEPNRRYRDVREFAEDISHYLKDEPVKAYADSRRYRVWKFVRRHRIALSAACLFLFMLAGFVALLLFERQATRRERDRAEEEALRAETTNSFLLDMFKVARSGRRDGHSISAYELVDNANEKLSDHLPESPAIRGKLRSALGTLYANLGLATPAEKLLEPALRDRKEAGARPEELMQIAYLLSHVECTEGRYQEAELHFEEALSLDRNASIPRWERESFLGEIDFAQGRNEEAERHFRKALQEKGLPGYVLATCENNLGAALHAEGRLAEARSLYERALASREKLYRKDHPAIFQSKHNLARLLEDEGKLSDALRLYGEAWDLRTVPGIYDLPGALILESRGSALTSSGKYPEAAWSIHKGLGIRRRILPDKHPDIARSLSELAREAHAEKHFLEAEPVYRESLLRLRRDLGEEHPDTLTVENNLSCLLVETGRGKEAREFLEHVRRLSDGRKLRPAFLAANEENLALLERAERRGRCRTLGTFVLDIGEPYDAREFRGPDLEHLPPLEGQGVIRFADDFHLDQVDSSKWEYGGSLVTSRAGELRVDRTVTDSGGWARTKPIRINPSLPLLIRRRVKIHRDNDKFGGSMEVEITGYPQRRFGVFYADFKEADYNHRLGFLLFRQDANPMDSLERRVNASPFIPPLWDRWFDEELLYDSRTGEVYYSIDGKVRLAYNVGRMPPGADTITVLFSTWGWWTGHYQHMRQLEVRQ